MTEQQFAVGKAHWIQFLMKDETLYRSTQSVFAHPDSRFSRVFVIGKQM